MLEVKKKTWKLLSEHCVQIAGQQLTARPPNWELDQMHLITRGPYSDNYVNFEDRICP